MSQALVPSAPPSPEVKLVLQCIRDRNPRVRSKDVLLDGPCPPHGDPDVDFLRYAIRKGWAAQDGSTPLRFGQVVTLTAAGKAALAS